MYTIACDCTISVHVHVHVYMYTQTLYYSLSLSLSLTHTQDLSSVVDFPHQMSDLRTILKQVDDFHKVRQRLTAEMADNSGVIRNLVVRAEDARMMNDM